MNIDLCRPKAAGMSVVTKAVHMLVQVTDRAPVRDDSTSARID